MKICLLVGLVGCANDTGPEPAAFCQECDLRIDTNSPIHIETQWVGRCSITAGENGRYLETTEDCAAQPYTIDLSCTGNRCETSGDKASGADGLASSSIRVATPGSLDLMVIMTNDVSGERAETAFNNVTIATATELTATCMSEGNGSGPADIVPCDQPIQLTIGQTLYLMGVTGVDPNGPVLVAPVTPTLSSGLSLLSSSPAEVSVRANAFGSNLVTLRSGDLAFHVEVVIQ